MQKEYLKRHKSRLCIVKTETIWIRFESWRKMRFWYYMFSFWCIRAKAKVNSSIISRILCTASIYFQWSICAFLKMQWSRGKTQYCLLCNSPGFISVICPGGKRTCSQKKLQKSGWQNHKYAMNFVPSWQNGIFTIKIVYSSNLYKQWMIMTF